MKAGVFAIAAAAVVSGVAARKHGRHAHEAFHLERAAQLSTASASNETCGCTTYVTTITGAPTLYFPPAPSTSALPSTSTIIPSSSVSTKSSTSSPAAVVPTPNPTTCPTPGTYTIPATTLTLTESTTVCAATSATITPGVYTTGGVTTIVTEATTVTCPYAAVSTDDSGVVTSTILSTTYVCPAAGTYTVGPVTTTANASTVWVYPVPTSYAPGTYTAPEITTTITATDYVVYCPFTSSAEALASTSVAPVSTTAPAVTYAPASSSSVYVAPYVASSSAVASSSYVEAVASTSSAAPQSSSTSSSSLSSLSNLASSVSLGSTTDQWAIVYTPYTSTGSCKTQAEVLVDVALIALRGFSALRVYSTDCSALEFIGNACEISGVKMILGVYISSTGTSAAQEQVSAIVAWAKWDLVELISVGNEAVFNGYITASALAGFISSSAASFKGAGYTGPVTTTEPLNIWQASTAELCSVVDVVGCNIHPFFNAAVSASEAGSFVSSQLSIVDGLCSGKSGITLETGWPTAGSCNGAACPGTSEQSAALSAIRSLVGGKSCILSFANDLWKTPGEFGCEQSWGAIDFF
ncbi:hypothetical protein BP5796_07469 [Coleophoma crateriformis]|uniref:Probable beta-glucosidase btgE n=1 Tax=Coleophoma crateriformis TaxID=565419 RepID=A0A3D8RJ03_9HELO|nr:hypothetical protein BP5796_07469 [Coleophoma crateriformis]